MEISESIGLGNTPKSTKMANMKRRIVAWVVVALTVPGARLALAEPVRGRVVDGVDDAPIPGALVQAGGATTITDADGAFDLDAPDDALEIVVSAVSYRATTAPIGASAIVRLAPDRDQGETISIEGRAPAEAETPTYELTGGELRSMPGTGNDALKSLQSLPGVARVPFGAGGLVLRGASPRDSAVYIDGIEVPILYHFGGLASVYPSSLLQSIELAPGGFGVEYGRARGGVVTVDSRPGRGDQWRAAGEVSLLDASVQADGPAAGGTWSLGFRRSYVDAVLALALPEDSAVQLTVAPRYYDGQLRYDLMPTARDQISLFLFGSDDRLALVTDDGGAGAPDDPDRVAFRSRFVRLAGRWIHRDGRTRLVVIPHLGIDQASVGVGDQGQTRTTLPIGARATLTRDYAVGSIAGGIELDAGQYRLALRNEPPPMPGLDTDMELVRDTRVWNADLGAWLEGIYRIEGGRVAVRPGVRIDRYGLSGEWVLDPRLTVSHALPAGITLQESFGIYHQPPSPADSEYSDADIRSSYAVHGAVGVSAELGPQTSASATAFAQQSHRLAVDAVSAASPAAGGGRSTSGGAGSVSGEVLFDQFGSYAYLDDVGRGRAHGLEVLVKHATPRFYGWLAYTYSRSLRRDDPRLDPSYHPYVLDQPHVLTSLASYQLTSAWRFGARLRYASGNPYTPVAGTYFDGDEQEYVPIDGAVLGARLPAFFQLDLRVDRQWRRTWGTLALFLDIQNVTNRVNPEGIEYSYDYQQQQYTRGLPIFPSLGLEYRP